jgi:uncharacterized protein (TIGR03067 family)
MFMVRGVCVLLVVALVAVADDKPQEKADPVKEDTKALQGTWVVESAERDGEDLSRIKGNKLVIKDNLFTVHAGTNELKGNFQIDPAKKLKTMDMQHDEGMLANKKWEAIYKLDGDTLTYCYSEADSGKDRPDAFETSAGQSRLLIVLKREKTKK